MASTVPPHPASLPSTMPAAVYRGPGEMAVEELAVPELGPAELLVEVAWCGVCGSDIHFFVEHWARPGSIGGHEWSGTVVAVGTGVADWAPGDRVVGGPSTPCGRCEMCAALRPSLCYERATPGTDTAVGAFARYTVIDASTAVRVPEGLDLRVAALAEPLAVALHGITASGVTAGQRAFVSGAGPIGALVVAGLRAGGVDRITVSEPNEGRADLVRRLGAERVVDPADLDVPGIAEPMRIVDGAHHVALECSGRAPAMEAALAQLRKGGTLVLVGAGIDPPRFDPNRILLNELRITGSFEYDHDGFEQALALLAAGAVPTDVLLEPDDVGLAGLLPALERLARGEVAGKVMVRPGA